MLNKTTLFIILFGAILSIKAQDCTYSIQGRVLDHGTQFPLCHVNILVNEQSKGTSTDEQGNFHIGNLCAGEFHVLFSHIGCQQKKIHLNLDKDTTLSIDLSHTTSFLGTIDLDAERNHAQNHSQVSINRKSIEDNPTKNISGLIENETGVHLIKNGSGISKPVVHGLYGNRLTIINNGIVQSGQQWGSDHGPEIDPFSSNKITVIKGTSAIEYGGGNLGSVLLIESKKILPEPHLHGQINYAYESNGRGNNLNIQLEKHASNLAWRINGTLKKSGDKKSSSYFLNNTGSNEANFSVQLEKSWNDQLFIDFYGSSFNTQLGVLRGAHIGNLTDLEEALIRDIPFYTETKFSYDIDAPKQKVSHHLAKIDATYIINDEQQVQLILGVQSNHRKEYDVRRSGRSDIPALSLLQNTFNSEIKYSYELKQNWKLRMGNQTIITDNTNQPETGILPLIPDYISVKSGLYTTLSRRKNQQHFNLGVRYDNEQQKIANISTGFPKKIIRHQNNYDNISLLASYKFNLSKKQTLSVNTGFASRNPGINELFSNGVHQGVSSFEEGNVNLNTEKAIKNTFEYQWLPNTNFTFNALLYHQYFKDYIFLKPQDEMKLTIRGAFPFYRYEQTNASISGIDLSTQFTLAHSLFGKLKYSYLHGEDITNKKPLVYTPPNSLYWSLKYQRNHSIKLSKNTSAEALEIEINNKIVFKQNNLLEEQDFTAPPNTYSLFGMRASTRLTFPEYQISCFAKVENLFNTPYRDYLNKQRYFSDDIGISISLGMNFKF